MLAPHRVGRTYHNFRGNKINDYALKSCIFFEDNDLWITGSYTHQPDEPDLEFSDRRPVLSEIDVPGMKKLQDFGDTGTPRLPNGRPVPKILLSLMRMVPSQGIAARSDRAAVTFGKGLPEDELAYLHALIRKTLTD